MPSQAHLTYIDGGEHVLEGHVGQEQKDGAIDVHDAHLRQLLPEKDESNEHGNHLQSGKKNDVESLEAHSSHALCLPWSE